MTLPEHPGWTVWQAADGRWYATRHAPNISPATLDALSEEQLRKKLTAQQKESDRA